MLHFLSLVLSLTASRVLAAAPESKSRCSSFKLSNLSDTALTAATYYAHGDLVNLTSSGGYVTSNDLVSFCRLQLTITTNSTANSSAHTELWLPDAWNSRLLGVGNGGFSGGVVYSSLSYEGIQNGFASFSTDTGHTSSSSDGSWALGNPNAIVDFGTRAMHMSLVSAKEITRQFYGEAAHHSYYLGCSTGGRQGLKEIQTHPESFDGVVVGAPANWMSHLLPWEIKARLNVEPVNSSRWITASQWSAIHDEVLKQCDAVDGVSDGIISNPRQCNFRPEALTCRPSANTSACLNLDQLAALHKIYRDYVEANNTWIFSRYEPGGELVYSSAAGVFGPTVFQIGIDYYRYLVLNDSSWDPSTLDYATIQKGIEVNPGQMDAVSPNITGFASRGGKLLHYVGWADQLIAPGNSLLYYESVVANTLHSSTLDPDSFYRLFTVPGMIHCSGGDGANAFGGTGQAAYGMPPGRADASHDIMRAMVKWVEHDTAPKELIATKYNGDNATLGTAFTRKLCMYPKNAVFRGGDNTTADSFECE
ncbi:hypothetical protein PLICRDRAFT_133973 [Plicaturopsis crispa FD-325 SS-3]|nr:hypothetical protein PLICRDRAFT_133973 [Plicaturopsis crispa FD-325 SS-3]